MEIMPNWYRMMGRNTPLTMFLLPEGTTVGSRLKLENFQWSLCG